MKTAKRRGERGNDILILALVAACAATNPYKYWCQGFWLTNPPEKMEEEGLNWHQHTYGGIHVLWNNSRWRYKIRSANKLTNLKMCLLKSWVAWKIMDRYYISWRARKGSWLFWESVLFKFFWPTSGSFKIKIKDLLIPKLPGCHWWCLMKRFCQSLCVGAV